MNGYEYKNYMAKYNAMYKKRRRPTTTEMFNDGKFTFADLKVEPTMNNFIGNDLDNPIVCSHFGCATHLSNEEKRFGTKCIHHQKQKKLPM